MNVLDYRNSLNQINEVITFLRGKYLIRFNSVNEKEAESLFLEGTCT